MKNPVVFPGSLERLRLVHVLAGMVPSSDEAVQTVINGLVNDPSPAVRYECAMALGLAHSLKLDVISALLSALQKDMNPAVSYACALALTRHKDQEQIVIPHLITLLDHPSVHVQYNAILCLGSFRASAAVPNITAFLHNDDYELRSMASLSLQQIRDDDSTDIFSSKS